MTHRPTADRALAGLWALVWLGALGCDRHSSYRIGAVLNVDGLRSARLSAVDVNSRGGIDGHPLEVVAELNGGTDAVPALATAERLASDPTILAVVGHTNSAASLAASQVYNARHIVQIAPNSSSPLYSKAGPYSFRLVPSEDGVRRRVLIVDDEPSLREIGRRLLSRAGLDVIVAASGVEALEILGREEVDLEVTDLRMPGEMDGTALLAWLARERPELARRALLVTGDVSGAASVALPVPAHRVLQKPVEGAEFVRRVRQALALGQTPEDEPPTTPDLRLAAHS